MAGSGLGCAAIDHLRERHRAKMALAEPLVEVLDHLARTPAPAIGVEHEHAPVAYARKQPDEDLLLGEMRIGVAGGRAPQHDAEAEGSSDVESRRVVFPVR